jgi:NAD(P)-dependent dehydrogenase (short-subunit alcohol dehydrogenase family)
MEQKTAILTGVTSGIGEVLALNLMAKGWRVVGLVQIESDPKLPKGVLPRRIDLSDLTDTMVVADKIAQEFPQVSAFVHMAGIWHDAQQVLNNRKLDQFNAFQIMNTMNVGVTACMVLASYILPKIVPGGAMIGVSGTFDAGARGWVPYFTSKRALEDFIFGLSQDYPEGPRVYGVSPADTATPAYQQFFPQTAATAQSPQAVAQFIEQLLEPSALYQTGSIMEVRNGTSQPGYHK